MFIGQFLVAIILASMACGAASYLLTQLLSLIADGLAYRKQGERKHG
jgi:hypothetical protein